MIILLKRFSIILAFLFVIPFTAHASDSASSTIVMDMDSLTILYEKNIYEARAMASTTKIMSALLACESGRLNELVTISDEMLYIVGSSIGLRAGDRITLYDLTVAMLLASGNDAANAVAFFLAGGIDKFSDMMNKRAKEIGMNSTVFETPSGLDDGNHHSTAYDMALLTASALKNQTFASICKMKTDEIKIGENAVTIYNHNKLLHSLEGCVGVKTGFTSKAGRCLVSAVEYQGNILICVTLNGPNDWKDHTSLIEECKKKYQKYTVSDTLSISVVGGTAPMITAEYSVEVTALENSKTAKVYYYPFLYAPVGIGDTVGYAIIGNNKVPITAKEDVKYNDAEE